MDDDNQDARPGSSDAQNGEGRPGKRQRNFIARQACEACRLKKTRCDEDIPCSLCRTLGIECTYTQRKPTKNEVSMSMVFNTLRRMEAKLDGLSDNKPEKYDQEADADRRGSGLQQTESPYQVDSAPSHQPFSSPISSVRRTHRQPSSQLLVPFSAHQTIHWPGLQALLPYSLASNVRSLEKSYPTQLESNRPSLSPVISGQAAALAVDWLASLSLTCVKDLSNAYFDTFNRVYPFVDRDSYFANTLAVVIRDGFGPDIESCLVLNIVALGCMGLKSFEEGGFSSDTSYHAAITPLVRHIMDDETPGLSFFNEARGRVGLCLCERTIEACQYYLTSAVFYAQVLRPVDKWMMTNRAAIICTAFWKCPPEPHDDWQLDMHSRLFWCSLVLESLVIQELELPPSGLKSFEDEVPLPKFTRYPSVSTSRGNHSDDSFYHYHFLAQIAQRIILNRIRDELFFSNPSTKLAEELRHQLEQWRENLPEALQYASNRQEENFACPADAVVVALLQMRYRVSIFHLGRPFLYKAIHNPSAVSDTELKLCAEALEYAMDWHLTLPICASMKNFAPLKYFCCGQFFGQLLIFHAFSASSDHRLRDTLPSGYEAWCTKMLRFIHDFADSDANPTIAKDFELLSALYQIADG